MTGILLAGGKSSRMGKDKAFLKYRGEFLFNYPLKILEKFCNEILLSGSDNKFNYLKYKLIPDEIKNVGPLGGIYSCLKKASFCTTIIMSCDNPLITNDYIEFLLSESSDSSLTVGRNSYHKPEPLPGIYSTALLPVIEKQLSEQNYRMSELLIPAGAKILNPDPNVFHLEKILYNVNTLEDLKGLNSES